MNSNDDTQEWKRLLPLAQLMQKLGYDEHAKRRAHCPFHQPDRKPSFSVFEIDGNWFWNRNGDLHAPNLGPEYSTLEVTR